MPISYSVEVLPIALRDMEEAVSYIAKELGSPEVAASFSDKLVEGINSLSRFPTRCSPYYPPRKLKHEYRKLPVGNYLLFFWVSEEEETVTVARMLHSRMDTDSRL